MRYYYSIFSAVLGWASLTGRGSHSLLLGIWLIFALGPLASAAGRAKIKAFFARRWAEADGNRGVPWRAAFFLVGLPAFCLALLNGRSIASYDNYGVNLMAAAIVTEGTVELSSRLGKCEEPIGYFVTCRPNGVYSSYPMGTVALAVPLFALARLGGADLYDHKVTWRIGKFSAAWTAAAIAMLVFLTALRLGDARSALVVSVLLFAASGVLSTIGQGLWSHAGVTVGLSLVFFLALRGTDTLGNALLIGFALSLMFASRLTSAVMIGPLLLWLLWRNPRHGFLCGTFAAILFLPWAAVQWNVYGHPLGVQFALATTRATYFSFSNYSEALYGLLLSPGTGLFIFQPWAWFLFFPPARPRPRDLTLVLIVISLAHLALMGTWKEWTGQICWGTRYLTEILPCLALLLVPVIPAVWQRPVARRVFLGTAFLGFLIQANGVFYKGGEWYHHPPGPERNFEKRAMDWSDPAFLYPLFR